MISPNKSKLTISGSICWIAHMFVHVRAYKDEYVFYLPINLVVNVASGILILKGFPSLKGSSRYWSK